MVPNVHVRRSTPWALIRSANKEVSDRIEVLFQDSGYLASAVRVCQIGRAVFNVGNGLCLARNGQPIAESEVVAQFFTGAEAKQLRKIRGKPVIHCFHASSPYAHILLDGLAVVNAVLPFILDGARLLWPAYLPDWALPMALQMGVPADRVLRVEANTAISDLWVSTAIDTRNTFLPHPILYEGLRSLVTAPTRRERKIYLFRRKGGSDRVIVNETEVISALQRVGVEVVDPVGMTIRDQMTLFSEARLIVGAHGSGWANLVFAGPGTEVIDLMPDDWVGNWDTVGRAERWVLNMTSVLNQSHTTILCRSEMDGPPRRLCGVSHAIRSWVDIPSLMRSVTAA